MDMAGIVIIIAWLIMGLLTFTQYSSLLQGMKKGNATIAYLIFIIGGPFFCVTTVLNEILNWIMPEGWDSEDDDGHGV